MYSVLSLSLPVAAQVTGIFLATVSVRSMGTFRLSSAFEEPKLFQLVPEEVGTP